jgi:hypothetical protein
VSNRRKIRPTPPPGIRAYQRVYRCTDCPGRADRLRRDRHGIWHVDIVHEPSCPVLTGRVSRAGAGIAASKQTAALGERVLYVLPHIVGADPTREDTLR